MGIGDVWWKSSPGSFTSAVEQLPPGGLEPLIYHAYATMKQYSAYIWGLAPTLGRNGLSLQVEGISSRNGQINGFLYGFINRHCADLQPNVADATEDVERSARFYKKDAIVLRYRMYSGETKC